MKYRCEDCKKVFNENKIIKGRNVFYCQDCLEKPKKKGGYF